LVADGGDNRFRVPADTGLAAATVGAILVADVDVWRVQEAQQRAGVFLSRQQSFCR
jgi:hypothetical protein